MENKNVISVKVTLNGRVQGIGFRWFVKRIAEEEGVKGYIKNNYDGSVEIVAECDKESFDRFLQRVKTEHDYAKIYNVDIIYQPFNGYKNFYIKF